MPQMVLRIHGPMTSLAAMLCLIIRKVNSFSNIEQEHHSNVGNFTPGVERKALGFRGSGRGRCSGRVGRMSYDYRMSRGMPTNCRAMTVWC